MSEVLLQPVNDFTTGVGEFELPDLGRRCLLAIDTSLGSSVAVCLDGRAVRVQHGDHRGHAEAIGSLLALAFEMSGVSPAAVEGVVVGIGPGPFTGLRVGIAAAKAFATGRGVPLMPLQGHEAVALNTYTHGSEADIIAGRARQEPGLRVLQDAKRREIFATEYAGLDEAGLPLRSAQPHLITHAEYREDARDVWPGDVPADQLLRLAALRLAVGRGFEADRALYLRAPDVYPSAAPKRVST